MKKEMGVSEVTEYDKALHIGNPVESLVLQLGVPIESVPRCTKALYVAFGDGNQPTQRIIEFLTFKISGKKA